MAPISWCQFLFQVGMSDPSVRSGPQCATPRTGPDTRTGWFQPVQLVQTRPVGPNPSWVSGDSEILSGGQSQVCDGQPSWTSGTDSGGVRNVIEFFFCGSGGPKTKGGNKTLSKRTKIEGSLPFHNFMFVRLAGIQNLLFFFKS